MRSRSFDGRRKARLFRLVVGLLVVVSGEPGARCHAGAGWDGPLESLGRGMLRGLGGWMASFVLAGVRVRRFFVPRFERTDSGVFGKCGEFSAGTDDGDILASFVGFGLIDVVAFCGKIVARNSIIRVFRSCPWILVFAFGGENDILQLCRLVLVVGAADEIGRDVSY